MRLESIDAATYMAYGLIIFYNIFWMATQGV